MKRKLFGIAVTACLVSSLAACSSGSSGTTTAAAAAAETTAAAAESKEEAPKEEAASGEKKKITITFKDDGRGDKLPSVSYTHLCRRPPVLSSHSIPASLPGGNPPGLQIHLRF